MRFMNDVKLGLFIFLCADVECQGSLMSSLYVTGMIRRAFRVHLDEDAKIAEKDRKKKGGAGFNEPIDEQLLWFLGAPRKLIT